MTNQHNGNASAVRAAALFAQFDGAPGNRDRGTGRLVFDGIDGFDVYNITAPFQSAGRTVIAGRVERRDSEASQVRFFEQGEGRWQLIADAPVFQLQDPFVSLIGGQLVFGGVETFEVGQRLHWRTVFYRGRDIFSLARLFAGPDGMKDIRLAQLADGRIGVFTRPQGTPGGRGTIGYTEVDRLELLSAGLLAQAPLLEGMFHPLDWGGANETTPLPNGEIGVLSHIAHFDHDDTSAQRHYYASSFIFDPASRTFRDFKIIASRDRFTAGPAKRPDLVDVVFSSGLVRANGRATLYAGVSDVEAHWLDIADPFADAQAARP
jgi:hypothetical protein